MLENTQTTIDNDLDYVQIHPEIPIKEALRLFNEDSKGIIFVCDGQKRLLGILTDGDFRRAMARGLDIDSKCENIMNKTPITVGEHVSISEMRKIMNQKNSDSIFYLPVVSSDKQIIRVVSRRELISEEKLPIRAVIMAGGFGSRLGEITRNVPKPMLKMDKDKSLLEHIIGQMVYYGISDIVISTHHLAEQIYDYFGDGANFNANISYVEEDKPLGTAGALSLLEDKSKPLLVMNGDVLTTVNFETLWRYHTENKSDITVACRQYDMSIPYGVVETDAQGNVVEIQEKPSRSFQVNAGIYLVQPNVIKEIPKNIHKNMTDIITDCCQKKLRVGSFVMHEYWLDVGLPEDYKKAQKDYARVFKTR